jgi:hypothetical protein
LDRRRNNDIHFFAGLKTPDAYLRLVFLVAFLFSSTSTAFGQFNDKSVDQAALPKVPDEFTVTVFASEPIVRQPCSMAFDEFGPDGALWILGWSTGYGAEWKNAPPVVALNSTGCGTKTVWRRKWDRHPDCRLN